MTDEKLVENIPLLLLDDEADNASVNTRLEDEDPTMINRLVRKLLKTFAQSSYVGYTATPFANIFITPDDEDNASSLYGPDLFPRNFIYYINPPVNYIGALKIFGFPEEIDSIQSEDQSLPLTRSAEDASEVFPPKHKKTLKVESLPISLIKAIESFVLVCAARAARGQQSVNNSMLIHVTRFNLVQAQVIDLVKNELVTMRRILDYRTGHQASLLLHQLEELWNTDFHPTSKIVVDRTGDQNLTPLDWKKIEANLFSSIQKIQVRGINGNVGGTLDYAEHQHGLHVIAIGGDKLSRGLTLEGLSVSYYIRPAQNYDTLLQMGRWFGYRTGYLDLCRLYTTDELIGWYQHITVATEELKREFRLMELSNLTPEDYGLKVRTHPAGLNITATNKIRSGRIMQVTFSGQLTQTTVFDKDRTIQENNFKHTENWLMQLGGPSTIKKSNQIWNNRPAVEIISFLRAFQTNPLNKKADTDLIIKYIEKLNLNGELINWTIMLVSSTSADTYYKIANREIGLVKRTDTTPEGNLYMLIKANILDPPDQYVDLKEDELEKALTLTIKAWEEGKIRSKNKPTQPSGPYIREVRPADRGLLLLYPLDPSKILFNKVQVSDVPFMGYAVSFSRSSSNELIEYKVNTKYWEDRYGTEDADEL